MVTTVRPRGLVRALLLLLPAGASLGLLGGCGGDEEPEASRPSASSSASPSTSSPASAPGSASESGSTTPDPAVQDFCEQVVELNRETDFSQAQEGFAELELPPSAPADAAAGFEDFVTLVGELPSDLTPEEVQQAMAAKVAGLEDQQRAQRISAFANWMLETCRL